MGAVYTLNLDEGGIGVGVALSPLVREMSCLFPPGTIQLPVSPTQVNISPSVNSSGL